IFVAPAREAVKQARRSGYYARLLPGISALDCMYADLGVDPGVRGMQIFESTDFVVNKRMPDLATPLVILQAGAAGVTLYTEDTVAETRRVGALAKSLGQFYKPEHQVMIYEAAPLPIVQTRADWIPLSRLETATLSVYSTLYVPAAQRAASDPAMLARLGLVERDGRIVLDDNTR
ncbi:MAG: SAM-dependent methyltransferase, partial [Thermoanaerobaculia bacterium]